MPRAVLPMVVVLCLAPVVVWALPAFPGAEGYGSETPGGRGGAVLQVTTTADAGPGSLREAMEVATGPRVVVFRVGGTIELQSPIVVRGPQSFLTVAGQSAPGDGVQLKNYGIQIRDGAHDVVVRFLRIRPGTDNPAGLSGASIDGVTLWGNDGSHVHHVVLDHVSMQWAIDENGNAFEYVTDTTFQWSMLAEGSLTGHPEGPHSMGILVGGGERHTVTLHHNLFAHNVDRNPRIADSTATDFRNNVVYDWVGCSMAQFTGEVDVNFVGNTYRKGPSTPSCNGIVFLDDGARIFLEDNHTPLCPTGCVDEWAIGVTGKQADDQVLAPFTMAPVTTHAAGVAETMVLASAGASLPVRDAVDTRIVDDVAAMTGAVGIGSGYPTLASGSPPTDTDADGMPDAWETAHGLDPNDPADRNGDQDADGYTNVEQYLNELVTVVFGCGDGVLQAPEVCDDGNTLSGDGCDVNCTPTACGNGVVSAGEACDDGNVVGGDCCSATCTAEPDGQACSDDDLCSAPDTCLAGACVGAAVPAPTCLAPLLAGKAKITLKNRSPERKDQIGFRWSKGAATTLADFGDPVAGGTDYAVCVYDGGAPGGRLIMRIDAPAGGTCDGKPCWKPTGTKGFGYKDKTLTPDGLQKLKLRTGLAGKSKATLKGKGKRLPDPTLPPVLPLVVQVRNTNGTCLGATFSVPSAASDEKFVAKSD